MRRIRVNPLEYVVHNFSDEFQQQFPAPPPVQADAIEVRFDRIELKLRN